jgi:hypothetical protein
MTILQSAISTNSLMEIICAWCTKHLGWTSGEGVTHGICPDCLKKQDRELEEMKRKK